MSGMVKGRSEELERSGGRVNAAAAWVTVAVIVVFGLLSYIDRQLLSLLVEPIKADLGLSDTHVGLLQGVAFALVYGIAGIPLGLAVDRYSRKILLWVCVTLWSLSAALSGLGTITTLFVGRVGVGIGEAALAPAAVALISENFTKDRRALPAALYASSSHLGVALAFVLGGAAVELLAAAGQPELPLLGEVAPWQAAFILLGLPGVLIALLAFAINDKPTRTPSDQPPASFRGLGPLLALNDRLLLRVLLGFGMLTMVSYSVMAWSPAFLHRKFGMSLTDIGLHMGLTFGTCGIGGAIAGGYLLDRLSKRGKSSAALWLPILAAPVSAIALAGAFLVNDILMMHTLLAIGLLPLSMFGPAVLIAIQNSVSSGWHGSAGALWTFTASVMGAGVGPLLVALMTDSLFGHEIHVGRSIAVLVIVALPCSALILLSALKGYKAASGSHGTGLLSRIG